MTGWAWPRTAAAFSGTMAILLVSTWVALLATGGVPELATRPAATWSLLAAEFTTAALLLTGAGGVLRNRSWAGRILLVALGMLLYTTIDTVGVSAEEGLAPAAAFMAIVAAGSAAVILRSLHEPWI
jgi:hypothetical protein